MPTFCNNLQLALVWELSRFINIDPVFELSVPRLHHKWRGVVDAEVLPNDASQCRLVGNLDNLLIHTKRDVIAKHSVC